MVGANTHSYVDIILLLADRILSLLLESEVLQSGNLLLGLDDGLEHVGIVVRVLALHHADQALKSHTGIDNVHRQRLKRAVSLTVELHEHDVPDLDDLWVVLVN